MRIEWQESEKIGEKRKRKGELEKKKNQINWTKKVIKGTRECLHCCVSPSRSSAVGQSFTPALVYN